MGIGFKEASERSSRTTRSFTARIGIGSDLSPFQPDSTIEIPQQPLLPSTASASLFNSETGGNNHARQRFRGQPDPCYLWRRARQGPQTKNFWEGNYWDDYQGFDRNGDGSATDSRELCLRRPDLDRTALARFFRSSPVMELLDFSGTPRPFSTPDLILRDESRASSNPPREPHHERRKPIQPTAIASPNRARFRLPRNSQPPARSAHHPADRRRARCGDLRFPAADLLQKTACARPVRSTKRDFLSSCIKCGQCVQVCRSRPSSWLT